MKTEHKEKVDVIRIRRITGYLVGSVDSFNRGKKAELADRTKNIGRVGYQQDKNIGVNI